MYIYAFIAFYRAYITSNVFCKSNKIEDLEHAFYVQF